MTVTIVDPNTTELRHLASVDVKFSGLHIGGGIYFSANHYPSPGGTSKAVPQRSLIGEDEQHNTVEYDYTLPADAGSNQPSPHDLAVGVDTLQGKVKASAGKFGDAYELEEGSIEIGAKEKYEIGTGSFSLSLWFTRNPNSTDNEARRRNDFT